MYNPIRDICLKIKQFFTFNKKEEYKLNQQDHDLLLKLSGIDYERERAACKVASNLIYEDLIPDEINRLLNDPEEFNKIKKQATEQAARDLLREERAKAFANIMEQQTDQAHKSIEQLENDWWAFFEEQDEEDPSSELFEKFLEKRNYLTQSQKENIKVPAIFVDEKITNPYQFHNELKRVKQLY